ncbi:MAG: energy-coupling factor ABC transporter ATP-binding protein [Desulfobacterales bacterium]
MNQPLYELRSLVHSYGDKTVVSIEHLGVGPGSILGIIGPNGSGKSSLLRLLGLIERPSQGKILFHGREVQPFSDEARFLVTLLPQEPFLMKRSVFNNVSYGLKLRGNGGDIAARVGEALAWVGLSSRDFVRRPWYALSGGEAQRVALAARLALQPKVLLLDEPTASVDAASAQLIKEAALRARQQWGATLIVASHDWQWLYEICDEIRHIFKGQIFGTGRESIIFGPWQQPEPGKWLKVLSGKQQLIVTAPPNKEAAAVLEDLAVSESKSSIGDDDHVLRGIVSRLSLEKNTGQVVATIIAGNLPFTVGLTPQQTQQRTIFPGKEIFIHYSPECVKWF